MWKRKGDDISFSKLVRRLNGVQGELVEWHDVNVNRMVGVEVRADTS